MLLEREPDLATLADRIDALREARAGGALLIEGPPGIGKTALLTEALAHAGDLPVLRARGSELETELAFGGVRQLFTAALRRLPEAERAALLTGPAALAASVLGFADGTPDALSDPLHGLYWLAADLADRAPLVIAVDDLHWLDEESRRFVAYLVPRLEQVPLLVLATTRPTAAIDGFDVLRPAPLSEAAVGELVPGRPAAAVQAATGGNPLLVAEVARAEPDVALDDIRPARLGHAVLRRVERVSPDAQALAGALALFGAGASLADAAAVAELALDDAARAADGLISAAVLERGEILVFAHPLMRAAVYEAVGVHARRAGHARAATVLRARGAPVEEVAAHILAAEPCGEEDSVAVLREAAERALAAVAPRAAVRYLERALEEPPPAGPERAALLRETGRLQAMLGRPEADATLTRALEEADRGARVDVAIELACVRQSQEEYRPAVEGLLPFVGTAELDPERTLMLDAMVAACAFGAEEHAASFRAAVDRIPEDLPGDTPAERFALIWGAWGRMSTGAPRDRLAELARRSVAPDASSVFGILGNDLDDSIPLLIACGELDLVEQLAEERMATASETGAEAAYAAAQTALAGALQMRGHWFRAEEQLRACLANPAALPVMTRWCESTLVEVLTILGRLDEAEEQLGSSFVGVAGELNGLMGRVREAELAYARGDYSKHDAFKDFVEYHQALGMTSPTMTRWQCHYAEGIAQCGRGEEAAALMKAYLERALEVGDPLCIGEAHTLLGRLSPTAAALAHFEQACDALRSTPHGWHLAAAELGLGAALRRDNQRVQARAPLQSALDYATRHGAAKIERQAREELGLIGARVHNPFLSGAESLTPAELRVARLAADGLTNREIAQHLFLTRKTVEMHMSRSLRKLDIASRKELPAALGDS